MNPITEGLNPYGMRDVHVVQDGTRWLLVGTDVPDPVQGQLGITLYESGDLQSWQKVRNILPRESVPTDSWYRDGWQAPELHHLDGRWWLCWSGCIDTQNPYGQFGAVLAVADQPEGPYKVITRKPLVTGNNFSLFQASSGKTYACWDHDGRIFGAEIDLPKAALKSAPAALWPEVAEGESYRLHVGPGTIEHDKRFYLFYSTFNRGYNIGYVVADSPLGPWRQVDEEPVFSWREHDCETVLSESYPVEHPFAPPTEIIGQVQPFIGPDGQPCFAYHSPDKYAEPRFCLDRFSFAGDGRIQFAGRTLQGKVIPEEPVLTKAATIPATIPVSPLYKVEVLLNGWPFPVPVYWAQATWKTNNSEDTAWASFDMTEPVRVRVTRLDETPISYCAVLPASRNIQPEISGPNCVEFTVDRPGQLSIEFESGQKITHPLLVFADPPEEPVGPDGPRMVYVGPGLHEWTDPLVLKSDQTLYLAAGAWVRGQVQAQDENNVHIRGRGVLDGIRYPAREADHMIHFRNVKNASVSGITIVNAPRFNVVLGGSNHQIRNVKMLGWWFSTDGVSTGTNSLIENCFFKVNDDAIKLYRSGIEARHCVIWQMENGAPFMISWNMPSDNAGFHAHDIDIIRVEHEWDNPNLAIVTAIHGSRGHMRDYLFENIRIDNCSWRPFHLITRPNHFGAWDPQRGSVSHITFRNIRFNGKPRIPSLIKGHDTRHPVTDIRFEKVYIDGQPVTELEPHLFLVDEATTARIEIMP